MTAPDLDALEKLADAVIGGWSKSRVLYEPEAATIKALIAELKEARGHLTRCVELVPEPSAIEAADAFLSRAQGEAPPPQERAG